MRWMLVAASFSVLVVTDDGAIGRWGLPEPQGAVPTVRNGLASKGSHVRTCVRDRWKEGRDGALASKRRTDSMSMRAYQGCVGAVGVQGSKVR